nr:zinc finger, CCHC-type [Tanacetum cinerariifolium]
MDAAAMKHMTSSFAKLEKFERVDFKRWQKKMHFMLSSMSVVYVLTTLMPEDGGENAKTSKELWDTLEAKYMAEDATIVNMVEHNNSSTYNDNKGKRKHHDTRANPNKKPKVTCWNCGKLRHLKKDCKAGNIGNRANGLSTKRSADGSSNPLKGQSMLNKTHQIYYVTYVSEAFFVQDDDVAWWVDSEATVHVCKDRCWFKSYDSLNDGSILHMGNESTSLVHERGCVDLRLNIVFDIIGSAFMSTSKVNDSILWHARLGHVYFKRMQDMSKDGLILTINMDTEECKTCMMNKITKKPFQHVKYKTKVLELIHSDLCDLHATPSLGNKKYLVTFIDDASRFCYVCLLHSKDEALDKFKSVGIIHETTALYTQQQNGISERKNRVLKEMVNFMLSYFGLSQGFWGEAMLTDCYLLNRVPNKRNRITPYEPWTKKPNLNYLRVWGCRAAVRLPVPKLKTLGEKDIECIFVGYVKHSKPFRFYVIEPNEAVAINSIIESRYAIFDEKRVTDEIVQQSELRKSKRYRSQNDFRPEFQLYLIEGTRDEGFKQKSEINYFDTYTLVARISTIRLLIAMASIHNLIIHQIDVKTTFLNGELEEEVYMNRPLGFIMSGNENKVRKLIKSLYGLKQAPKQWHQKFDEVVLSNGYYLIKLTNVDLTKECFLSRFSMKDIKEADVILGITIKHKSNADAQQRPDIAFAMGKLSRYTSNLGTQHWQALQRVLKYLKKTMDYRFSGYPSVLEGYTDASWISNTEDDSSISSWVFLLGGGVISWASKKQTCITGSIIKYEFVALVAASKEAEWLKNLLHEIPLWVKPMAPISINCDSAATLAKAYSQMYNGKSRHLCVRHSKIHELITNGVVSIEFRDEAHVLQIFPRMCLELDGKEDEVSNF